MAVSLEGEPRRQPDRRGITRIDDADTARPRSISVELSEHGDHRFERISLAVRSAREQPRRFRRAIEAYAEPSPEIRQAHLSDEQAGLSLGDRDYAEPKQAPMAYVPEQAMPGILPVSLACLV